MRGAWSTLLQRLPRFAGGECTFDRAELTHKVNLFDLHHKYADVMHVGEVVTHLDAMRMDRAAE